MLSLAITDQDVSMVRGCNTFSREPASNPDLERFAKFVGGLEKTYNLPLPYPLDLSSSALKKFCSELIEGLPHPWVNRICHLPRQSRFSLRFSLFLFRKTILSERPDLHSYMSRMSESSPPYDSELLSFSRKWIRKNMRGWDRGYFEGSHLSSLPVTSCNERGRKEGGCRGLVADERWSRQEFCAYVTESVVPMQRGPAKVSTVLSAGKWRTISCPPLCDNALRPLHKTLYNRLSKFDWLLRGDAKASSFNGFTQVPGEVFVSGDYESATDNLNMGMQKEILSALLDECVEVPLGIQQHVIEAYSGSLLRCGEPKCDCGLVVKQGRGQLMGQLLSFPLLCLVNYLTFLFIAGPDVPVRINGDDIVFRAPRGVADEWFSGVARSGLVVSKGKTLVDNKFFTLNSTPFCATSRKVTLVPFIRASVLWRGAEGSCEALQSLRGRFKALHPGMSRRKARSFRILFLEENSHTIYTSRRSLTRCLGLPVDEGELRESRLWNRELFYLDSTSEPELPSLSVSQIQGGGVPQGFFRDSKHLYTPQQVRGWSDRLAHSLVSDSWDSDLIVSSEAEDMWWTKCREGTSPYGVGSLFSKRVLRMLKMSRHEAWKWVYHNRDESVWGRRKWSFGDQVWVWRGERSNRRSFHEQDHTGVFSPITFVSATK
ncbi:RNA dependent RNA polymerase [Plasmopara viticola lesion associated ourmia-like virus 10]|uniref:RNA dependent RNA polymerase n=1 Tax=Plasmopara viticola lesion associated ourmia-like virus 10 TaxID=2686477 RepID=A0ABX6FIW2_9VIRU|nr:RNA dependent RNA polymerase [Plasmopara viticola lesion associated ourmia-like virus 10]QGY72540.1 RNA dependent RNA polymerase [Plasmopara viticola lesion associated ourmia-like virus 10]